MNKRNSIYHVGLFDRRNGTAEFQYRHCVDFLSCEILKYYGQRQQTKAEARKQLKNLKLLHLVLHSLNLEFPGRKFERVVIS